MSDRVLIAGCGRVGKRLAAALRDDGIEVLALKRNPVGLPAGVEPVRADLVTGAGLDQVPSDCRALVYAPTPERRDADAYRRIFIDGLANLLKRRPLAKDGRLLFVSSTAVHGQDHGEWVDETTPPAPARFNGRVLVEAEQRARAAYVNTTVVRFSGLYGGSGDRLPRRLRTGETAVRKQPPQWSNRIHLADAAGFLRHLLIHEPVHDLYLGSDDAPTPRYEVYAWLAQRLGAELLVCPSASAVGQGKRIDNNRLRGSGYMLQYPDYRSGYAELLA